MSLKADLYARAGSLPEKQRGIALLDKRLSGSIKLVATGWT